MPGRSTRSPTAISTWCGRPSRLADRLVLAIGVHPGKAPLFSAEERLAMLEETCAPLARAGRLRVRLRHVRRSRGRRRRSGPAPRILIRGLRDGTDFDYEMQMAGMNGAMAPRGADRVPAGLAGGPPDHRHFGAPDRRHGRRRVGLRAGLGRGPPEAEIRRQNRLRSFTSERRRS